MNPEQKQLYNEYHEQLRQEGHRFNDRKTYCSHVARDGIMVGMAVGVTGTFALAQLYMSRSSSAALEQQNQTREVKKRSPPVFNTFMGRLLDNWRRMMLHKRLKGIGLIMGSVGTLTGYFWSKMTYQNCIDPYIETMRKVANRRHTAYYDAVLDSGSNSTSK